MRIRDILSIKEFDPVVDLSWGLNIDKHEQMLSNYIMTENTADIFVDILESFNLVRSSNRREKLSGDINSSVKRSHIISGQYGTGKSYFLLMLSIILEMKNLKLAEKMIERFSQFPELQYQLKYIKENKKYFVVRINGELENEKEFRDAIQSRVLEALEKELENVQLNSVYKSLIDSLESFYNKNQDEIDVFLEKTDDTFEDLIASLSNHRKDGLIKCENLFKEVMGFKPHIEIESLDKFFSDVNKELTKNGYDELVIIFDEFSAYITSSLENKRINKDLGQIQTLAQLTSSNANMNVSFIASIHKDIKDILGRFGDGSNEELDKVLGRFNSYSLTFNQGNDLIKDSLKLNRLDFEFYENKYNEYIKKLEKKYHRNFLDFYPFHPATIGYLDPISQLYAQKTRTTLGFIKEVVKEKFFSQSIEVEGKLNLITLKDLFDSFENSINEKNPEIIKVYNQNSNSYSNDPNIIKYIKAITIAYASSLTKTNSKIELTSEDLKDIYQEESDSFVKDKLNSVVSANYSNIIVNNGSYRLLVNTSGIDIDKKLSDTMIRISPDTVMKSLLKKSENRIFIKDSYTIKYNSGIFPFDIELEGDKNTLLQLSKQSIQKISETNKSGKIIFALPEFQEEYNKGELIEKYSKLLENTPCNICLAFPNKILFNPTELKEYGALIKVEKEDEGILKNEELKKIIVKRRRKLEDKIRNKYIRQFSNLRNFTFIFGGGKIVNSLRQERKLYEEILYNYYHKFPREIKVENFNTRAALNEVIKISLDRGIGEIGKKDTSNGVKQLKLTLKPLDLISFTTTATGFKFELKTPSEEVSKISKEIMDTILKEEKLENKYNLLIKEPYGLNKPLVDLYIYVASKSGKITIHPNDNDKKVISLDAKSLEMISKNPSDYNIKLNEEANIPVEIERIWLTLASLRIVTSSKARSFKANSSNDFNPFIVLRQELETICSNLMDKEERLKENGVKTTKLKTLVNKLKDTKKYYNSVDFYDSIVKIPEIFKKESFNENMTAFSEFLDKIKKLTNSEITSFEKSQNRIKDLNHKIDELLGYGDLKKSLNSLNELVECYQNDFLNVEIIQEIDKNSRELLSAYNNEFKVRHTKYHSEYETLRKELINTSKDKINAIKILQNLKFNNISSVKDFIDEVTNYSECSLVECEDKILVCKECKNSDLKKLENNSDDLRSIFTNYKRRIYGIFENYIENLKQDNIKNEMIYNENYKELMMALNNISREVTLGNEINILEDKIELIEEKINNLIKDSTTNERSVEFNDITSKLILELQATGNSYLTLEEINDRFNDIITYYKSKDIKNAKI